MLIEYYLGNLFHAHISYISIPTPPDPLWMYPTGTSLALRFSGYQPATDSQVAQTYPTFTLVLKDARLHLDRETFHYSGGAHEWRYGRTVYVRIYARQLPTGALAWGDIIDTVIAAQLFIETYRRTFNIEIRDNDEQKRLLGTLSVVPIAPPTMVSHLNDSTLY